MSSDFQPADSDLILLRKIASVLGGSPSPGDTENALLRKILEALGSSDFSFGDTNNNLLRKILTKVSSDLVSLGVPDQIGLRPQPADLDTAFLRKILDWFNYGADAIADGTSPLLGDSKNNLLRKILTRLNLPGVPI